MQQDDVVEGTVVAGQIANRRHGAGGGVHDLGRTSVECFRGPIGQGKTLQHPPKPVELAVGEVSMVGG